MRQAGLISNNPFWRFESTRLVVWFADLPSTDRPDIVRVADDSEINSNLSRSGWPLNCAELITRTWLVNGAEVTQLYRSADS